MRGSSPLIHCITNYVTAGDTANMLLAAGASPIMADDPSESAEITALAQGLTLNLGTPSGSRVEAMLRSGAEATGAEFRWYSTRWGRGAPDFAGIPPGRYSGGSG